MKLSVEKSHDQHKLFSLNLQGVKRQLGCNIAAILFLRITPSWLSPKSKVNFRLSLKNYIDMFEPIKSVQHHNSQICVLRSCTLFISLVWGKLFHNGPSKICGRQPLKDYGLL